MPSLLCFLNFLPASTVAISYIAHDTALGIGDEGIQRIGPASSAGEQWSASHKSRSLLPFEKELMADREDAPAGYAIAEGGDDFG